ncbi:MFS transporter [Nocardioides lijunqiniae]|uniref:MFS transporter n=1 Tax=Nocardioides lijunqiniae TaxID=2760832 RepID=UPI0018777368|nr:MFS transporter [Nocardioides lijunqiniae]
MTSYRALAHNRDFTALWIGQTVSELGSQVSMFVFPLVAYATTGSALHAAAAEALFLGGMAAALLPAGVLADRVDRRRVMRTASAAGVLLYASLALAGAAGTMTLPHLLAVALLTGVAAGVFSPAEMAAVRAVVRPEDLPTALSQNQARQHVAHLVGAPLGGVLFSTTRWLPFAADAVSFALSWVLLGRIRSDLRPPAYDGPQRRVLRDLGAGVGFIARHPFFRVLTAWAALSNLVVNALFFLAVLRLIEAGHPPLAIALVSTAGGVCGILGAIAAPWLIERLPTGRLTVVVAWSFVPLSVPMVFLNHPAVVAVAVSVGIFLNPAGNAGIQSYRISITPPELLGRTQSAAQFLSMSVMPLAPVVAGLTLSAWGGPAATATITALCALVALVPTSSRAVRSVPRPAQWASQDASRREHPRRPPRSSTTVPWQRSRMPSTLVRPAVGSPGEEPGDVGHGLAELRR